MHPSEYRFKCCRCCSGASVHWNCLQGRTCVRRNAKCQQQPSQPDGAGAAGAGVARRPRLRPQHSAADALSFSLGSKPMFL